MSFNRSQRIAVSTTLLQLEKSLDETERLLAGSNNGMTYATEVHLTPTTVQQLREVSAAIRREIAAMVDRFGLSPHRWFARQVIMAEMTSSWTNLEEIRPDRLNRYGAVDPALNETLSPGLERLIELVRAMQTLASRGE